MTYADFTDDIRAFTPEDDLDAVVAYMTRAEWINIWQDSYEEYWISIKPKDDDGDGDAAAEGSGGNGGGDASVDDRTGGYSDGVRNAGYDTNSSSSGSAVGSDSNNLSGSSSGKGDGNSSARSFSSAAGSYHSGMGDDNG